MDPKSLWIETNECCCYFVCLEKLMKTPNFISLPFFRSLSHESPGRKEEEEVQKHLNQGDGLMRKWAPKVGKRRRKDEL